MLAIAYAGIPHKSDKMGILNIIEEMPDTPRNPKPVSSDGVDIFHETLIHGSITCNGRPVAGARPFLQSPWYNNVPEVITTSKDAGYYQLFTNEVFKGHRSMLLTVRHQCPQENFIPRKDCAIPIYWFEISLPLVPQRLSISMDIELAKADQYTRSDCLI
uniref:Hemagglutinin glycoprotein n=1 Tax=Caenorhabditis tropicalis TaxID=1561998 RepID=A0A1I7V1S2_9PELO